jgi:hypothetical protein
MIRNISFLSTIRELYSEIAPSWEPFGIGHVHTMQQFLHHLNSVRPTIKLPKEVEANDTFPFLDVIIMKRGPKLGMKVYQKLTHTGRYLHLSPYVGICWDQKDFNNEIKNIRQYLMLRSYLLLTCRSSGSGTGSTQPREDNWGVTWMKK